MNNGITPKEDRFIELKKKGTDERLIQNVLGYGNSNVDYLEFRKNLRIKLRLIEESSDVEA